MTYISARHRRFSNSICSEEVLSFPEKYFGPNYKTLLNFWIYWESLSLRQEDKYFLKPFPSDSFVRVQRHSREITDVMNITDYPFYYIELEIMAAHILIDSGEPVAFIPLLEDL